MAQGDGRSYLQAAYFQVNDENIQLSSSQYPAISVTVTPLKLSTLHYIYCV